LKSPRTILMQGLMYGFLAAVVSAGALLLYVTWYGSTDRFAPGVHLGAEPVGGLRVRDGWLLLRESNRDSAPVVGGMNQPMQLAETTLIWKDRTWHLPSVDAAVAFDSRAALQDGLEIGRSGSILDRTLDMTHGWLRGHYLLVESTVKERVIKGHLEQIAQAINTAPRDAGFNLGTGAIDAESSGYQLDMEASLDQIRTAILSGQERVDLMVAEIFPKVTKQALEKMNQAELARFRTRILVADVGRVQNIRLAIEKIGGRILQPGEVFSFNEVVGPRDPEHGWAQAKELYQGEFVLGYGGGICQVSSTLYNAILLAGLQVKERYHHDRPLEYIEPGRDATVAFDLLDFRFANPLDISVLVMAHIVPGSPQWIEISLRAARQPLRAKIRLEDADVKYFPPEMIEVMDPTLPANHRKVEDEGYYGLEVKTYRVFDEAGRERRELVSHDRYKPKPGKVRVGIGNAPGAGRLLTPGLK
jgi:vancomycin resistance protein YoaR